MNQLRAVFVLAALVLSGSACGADSGHSHAGAMVRNDPIPGAREIRVEARSYAFAPAEVHLRPGEGANVVLAPTDIVHDFTVVGLPLHVAAKPGETATGGLTAPSRPGRYAFVCTIPGHREAGMTGVLVIDASA